MQNFEEITDIIWRFVRGDMPVPEFEEWLYSDKALESLFGPEAYLEIISVDFGKKGAVFEVKELLKTILIQKFPVPHCRCVSLSNMDVVDMGDHEEIFESLVRTFERGEPYWWLYTSICTQCKTHWLIASEERQNDVFCFRRLTNDESHDIDIRNLWPDCFDTYEKLLEIGREFGRSVRFVDPLESSLFDTIVDLAKQRPDIRISELANLLNIDIEITEKLAMRAIAETGVEIILDCR